MDRRSIKYEISSYPISQSTEIINPSRLPYQSGACITMRLFYLEEAWVASSGPRMRFSATSIALNWKLSKEGVPASILFLMRRPVRRIKERGLAHFACYCWDCQAQVRLCLLLSCLVYHQRHIASRQCLLTFETHVCSAISANVESYWNHLSGITQELFRNTEKGGSEWSMYHYLTMQRSSVLLWILTNITFTSRHNGKHGYW